MNADTHINISSAIQNGGCTIRFDDSIDINLEYHNNHVYLFSTVMQIMKPLSDNFFASILQIHLFGIATNRCWFGYDAGGQRVILFCLIDLSVLSAESALMHVETLIEQTEYWQENLPKISQITQEPSKEDIINKRFKNNLII
ncbi:type III secretion system chaperone [Candidatus Arsenophonus triatominarum]|uniref:type III secretion system chaperone n=1 Tax=Candidatus Arsenophonus triatominarum TaxID=57911 RepID=UPI00164FC6D1|nr:type III secretion system chaperone [Candidatus Arsenophonus triatominarum]